MNPTLPNVQEVEFIDIHTQRDFHRWSLERVSQAAKNQQIP